MKVTFVHPSIGRRPGENYMRTWQMESLPIAALAHLTPDDVEIQFFDDRMEPIDFDAPTDLVAIPIETYTAKRAYQIASTYRAKGIPVVMGGFHATLMPDEVAQYAEAVVIGEAESAWADVIDDARHGTLKPVYKGYDRGSLDNVHFDRSVFKGKRYLPLGLVETGRGCRFPCEFCAIQAFFGQTHRRRPVDKIVAELEQIKHEKRLFFFVDDNFAGSIPKAQELAEAIAPVNIRWVTQMSVDAAHNEEFVATLARSGCRGVLIGFESLERDTLRAMGKKFNTMGGGYANALANLRKYGIRIYGTFIFGYGTETAETFENAYDFAMDNDFFLAAFNHLTPFPGTPLYKRLKDNGQLHYDAWWLNDAYSYNTLPFDTGGMSGEEITQRCVQARKKFYSIPGMMKRGFDKLNRGDFTMMRAFFLINYLHRQEVNKRHMLPFGDPNWSGELLKVA
ncbi:B12-binding domain-containing radical SAM protein [Parasulfitobacter algicola]|uniref:B12-binding domain-containing radical SAM protein n=1 Tax=Parasulfitobacter algicola TaxID=2614809 RepID=A0ABX2ITU5_9RHOB|nr:radical SAM protein [Sulfitobacter algicola]NSX53784.1 B12-binding domain-containing radical SAM protein [Sulfitobacter algicola]